MNINVNKQTIFAFVFGGVFFLTAYFGYLLIKALPVVYGNNSWIQGVINATNQAKAGQTQTAPTE